MAMTCIRGGGECSGCMSCREEMPLRCPACGAELMSESRVYIDSAGLVAGCEDCIEAKEAWETPEIINSGRHM